MEGSARVWLEPEYDGGRTGVWLLDWPGAFVWGPTREAALARVPSAVYRFVEWLNDHGERIAYPPVYATEIVEEVTAFRRDDGYEVNATFAADHRPVTADELELQICRLGYARADLEKVIGAIRVYESAGGELRTEHRSAEKRPEDVLRHIAGAETWFVSRLDRAARNDGPRDDIDAYLRRSREFLVAGLRRIRVADASATRTDGKGEAWTLAKVLRRALYHSLDHIEELDRRLAQAERRADGLELRHDATLDVDELRRLFGAAGLGSRARESAEMTQRMLAGTTATVSAWEGERLVGFARIISDETTNGYISTVAVAPRWQSRGLGGRLMRALMEGREHMKLTLDARQGVEPFYERLGFRRASTTLVRPRPPRP